jgi:hypothetical protein
MPMCFGMTKTNYGKVTGDRTMADIQKRRTGQCIIPCATQDGEISFCAYNTGSVRPLYSGTYCRR